MTVIKAALIQQTCSSDRQATLNKTIGMITKAAASGAMLVVLQELHAGPYFCQIEDPALFDLAEPIPGPSSDEFRKACPRAGNSDRGLSFRAPRAGPVPQHRRGI